jgi:hypothetical protein
VNSRRVGRTTSAGFHVYSVKIKHAYSRSCQKRKKNFGNENTYISAFWRQFSTRMVIIIVRRIKVNNNEHL